VAFHARLGDKQRKEVAQFDGDAAMKLLRDALSTGYKDVVHTEKDTALAPLRQREHCQMLVADLVGKGPLAMAADPETAGAATDFLARLYRLTAADPAELRSTEAALLVELSTPAGWLLAPGVDADAPRPAGRRGVA
jgi:hypothetical protein